MYVYVYVCIYTACAVTGYYSCKNLKLHGHTVDVITFTILLSSPYNNISELHGFLLGLKVFVMPG